MTTSGYKCVFPFKYKTIQYFKCTTVDSPGRPWCAIAVDSTGTYVYGQWDYCGTGSAC